MKSKNEEKLKRLTYVHKVKVKSKERSNQVRRLVLDIKSQYHISSFGLAHKQQITRQKTSFKEVNASDELSCLKKKTGIVTTVFGGNPLLIEYNRITCIQR